MMIEKLWLVFVIVVLYLIVAGIRFRIYSGADNYVTKIIGFGKKISYYDRETFDFDWYRSGFCWDVRNWKYWSQNQILKYVVDELSKTEKILTQLEDGCTVELGEEKEKSSKKWSYSVMRENLDKLSAKFSGDYENLKNKDIYTVCGIGIDVTKNKMNYMVIYQKDDNITFIREADEFTKKFRKKDKV